MRNIKRIKVVCFGGGTGLPSLLSGLKENELLDLTAAPTVFDNGGSSGVLRDKFGILPPGDVLRCLLALAENEKAARDILLTRIEDKEIPSHTGGNLLLLALEKVYKSFPRAIVALGKLLNTKGQVLPVSSESSTLVCHHEDGSQTKGEIQIDQKLHKGISPKSLALEPEVSGNKELIPTIEEADIICVGPGSFYTSVLPCFLPKGIKEAIGKSRARIIFIANILTEGEGMKSFDVESAVEIVEDHIGKRIARVVVNSNASEESTSAYTREGKYPLQYDQNSDDPRFISSKFWKDPNLARHDSKLLAFAVSAIIHELTSPSPR